MVFPRSFPEAAFGSVPFEDESARESIPALVDGHGEGGRADGVGEPAGKRRARPGPRRRNEKPERGCGRLGETRLAQEEKGTAGLKRAAVQPPCRGEVEPVRIAPDLEEHRRKGFKPRRFLGDPERILEPVRVGEKNGLRSEAEPRMKARKIGEARFAEYARRADPEERPAPFLEEEAGQRKRKAGHRSGIAHGPAMQFDEAGARQSAGEGRVEHLCSRPQKGRPFRHAVAAHENVAFFSRPADRRIQPVGEDALDPGDFPAQGANGLPRHGAFNHGGIRS
jgi:hypothetical protein